MSTQKIDKPKLDEDLKPKFSPRFEQDLRQLDNLTASRVPEDIFPIAEQEDFEGDFGAKSPESVFQGGKIRDQVDTVLTDEIGLTPALLDPNLIEDAMLSQIELKRLEKRLKIMKLLERRRKLN